MTLIVDAAPLAVLGDARDRLPSALRRVFQKRGELVVPAPVSAEVDYLLDARLGRRSRHAFLEDVAAGRFRVACLDEAD